MIRVFHYRNKCIGCYACVAHAPSRWRMSKKDGKSVLLEGKEKKGVWSVVVSDEEREENLAAARVCPVGVIQVR